MTGCDPSKKSETAPAGDGQAGVPIVLESAQPTINIGDMEAALYVEARPALNPPLPQVRIENLETIDGTVRMTTVDVSPPAPAELPMAYRLSIKRDFMRDGVAAVRFDVVREVDGEETVLGSFATAAVGPMVFGQKVWPLDFEVNALEGLDRPPSSMLLSVRGSILLLAPDVDQETLDPATAEVPAERTSRALRANPVRINFQTSTETLVAPAPAPAD
jgi:hypothetical protein